MTFQDNRNTLRQLQVQMEDTNIMRVVHARERGANHKHKREPNIPYFGCWTFKYLFIMYE